MEGFPQDIALWHQGCEFPASISQIQFQADKISL